MKLLIVALAITVLAPTAAAQDVTWTVIAKESGCADGKTFCFEITEGVGESLPAGGSLTATLQNEGTSPHNLHVTDAANADESHGDTSGDAAIESTPNAAGGESQELTLDIPADVGELYFWCDVTGHESLGMWFTVPVTGDASTDTGNGVEDADGDGGDEETPMPFVLAPLALAGAALLLARRR